MVVEKVNRVLDGVVDVEVEWNAADLHGRVGEHIVETTVTRLASTVPQSDDIQVVVDDEGREVTSQCFHVPFTILDTNECNLPTKHPMRHACPYPSVCVNTIGSYECLCPKEGAGATIPSTADDTFWEKISKETRSPWELSFASSGETSCPSMASTHGCCPASTSTEGHQCRKKFHCPVDPCSKSNCASNAECVRADSPMDRPDYSCVCPQGLMGSGRACQPKDPKPEPKLMYDGVTPTEKTLKNGFYCGCTEPIIDACSGFPPCKGKHEACTVTAENEPVCACKPGYVPHEKYGCVDVHPPTLKLRHDPDGDQTLRLKQGDEYREYMVDIIDENAEDYLRSLKISYSRPLPTGCLTQVGEFHVNYTVAMPWANPPYVRIIRRVVIDDIDECRIRDISKFQHSCPSLVPQCDKASGAKCINTIGSYACQCPSQSSGDGFLESAKFGPDNPAPRSYKGGTGCVDTSKPIITLKGPNPKIFRICECGGLSGLMSKAKNSDDSKLHGDQRKLYEQDIKEMIRATSGAELCASHSNPNPRPSDCVRAIDQTYQGDVDLSSRVVVGEPQQKSSLHWVVPYNVKDDAGNEATTVWRDVKVEEVNLSSLETKIRHDVMKEQEASTNRKIQDAIRAEKVKWERANASSGGRGRNKPKPCPECPPCNCEQEIQTTTSSAGDDDSCKAQCEALSGSCKMSDDNFVYSILFGLQDFLSPQVLPSFIFGILILVTYILIKLLMSCFNQQPYQSRYDYGGNDDILLLDPQSEQKAPTSTRSTTATPRPNLMLPPPPRDSLSSTRTSTHESSNGRSFFSPGSQVGDSGLAANGVARNEPPTPASANRENNVQVYDDSIYNTPSIITPSRTGDGVRRRNPYT